MILAAKSGRRPFIAALGGCLMAVPCSAFAADDQPRDVVRAVVGVRSTIPAQARTAETLGRERWGSGIVIDNGGLILTIGYLILEASTVEIEGQDGSKIPADIVAYDHESGFGLVRALTPLKVRPAAFGNSKDLKVGDPALVLSFMGVLGGRQVQVVDRRPFAGYWEYLLEEAIFTTPEHPAFSGAPLIDREGRLVAMGSLRVADTVGQGIDSPGNMFVPIEALKPVLGELLSMGQRDGPSRPWIGVYSKEGGSGVLITGVASGSPAEKAGLAPGDVVVSVAGTPVTSLSEFYRSIWAQGEAGTVIPLMVRKGVQVVPVDVASIDRRRWLKLQGSF